MMMKKAVAVIGLFSVGTSAFQGPSLARTSTTALQAQESSQQSSRRQFFGGIAAVGAAIVASTAPQPAEATYSAYTNREKDWAERNSKGEVKYSSARELRSQLAEIAPMNTESSKIFCPNGPSASVSPLMENKCGDRLAMPSVYGRTEDVMGNSIPGFAPGFMSAGSSIAGADVGGLPDYGFTVTGRSNDKFSIKGSLEK